MRAKDAADFEYLIQSYSKVPQIYDALYEDGYMEAQEWNETKASAMKLGTDVAKIASVETIAFLKKELFLQPDRTEQFVREMQNQTRDALSQNIEIFNVFANEFSLATNSTYTTIGK